uniref:Sh3 domain-binding glutamic acid-rich n=1 Tax=Anopheles triannulatus TaxID=58253 RepID=A0A2M4AS35_9DIPT
MVIKVYISGMSGNKEVKKRQQRVALILDSKHIEYTVVDITEPGQEEEKVFMQTNAHKNGTTSEPAPAKPLPPQIFNDTVWCGDYEGFDAANEEDKLEEFLKLAAPAPPTPATAETTSTQNGAGEETADAAADENKENKTEDNNGGGDTADAAAADGANDEV